MLRRLLLWGLRLGLRLGATSGPILGSAVGLSIGLSPLWLTAASDAHAAAPEQMELTVSPAWKGWSRPGRETELQLQLRADTATRVGLEISAGHNSTHTEVDLQPGRTVRLQVPVRAVETLIVHALPSAGPAVRRVVDVSLSESPVLAAGLAGNEPVQLDGFHTIALTADDLPRHASAYASIDALIVDASTLAALDHQQLRALMAHAAACGRIVAVNTDLRVQRLLAGAGGCGSVALLSAATVPQARALLLSSLAASLPPAMTLAGMGELVRPELGAWNRVATMLAIYVALGVMVIVYRSSVPLLLLLPALASLAALAALHTMQPAPRMAVWSEGEAGAPSARYQSWQRIGGLVRGRTRVALPPQLAGSAQPCDPSQAMRFELDAGKSRVAFAEFDTRLFQQVLLCYAGSFPMSRVPQVGAAVDGLREARNAGSTAWPKGRLIAEGRVHDLPALAPGARAAIELKAEVLQRDAAARAALARVRPDETAMLWELDLGGVADVPADAKGWLLVAVPTAPTSPATGP